MVENSNWLIDISIQTKVSTMSILIDQTTTTKTVTTMQSMNKYKNRKLESTMSYINIENNGSYKRLLRVTSSKMADYQDTGEKKLPLSASKIDNSYNFHIKHQVKYHDYDNCNLS